MEDARTHRRDRLATRARAAQPRAGTFRRRFRRVLRAPVQAASGERARTALHPCQQPRCCTRLAPPLGRASRRTALRGSHWVAQPARRGAREHRSHRFPPIRRSLLPRLSDSAPRSSPAAGCQCSHAGCRPHSIRDGSRTFPMSHVTQCTPVAPHLPVQILRCSLQHR